MRVLNLCAVSVQTADAGKVGWEGSRAVLGAPLTREKCAWRSRSIAQYSRHQQGSSWRARAVNEYGGHWQGTPGGLAPSLIRRTPARFAWAVSLRH